MTRPHVIYIVVGRCGEYSDSTEWPVCWRASKEEAEAMIAILNAEAEDFKRKYESAWDDDDVAKKEAARERLTDSAYQESYTGTTYGIWTVSDDPTWKGTP